MATPLNDLEKMAHALTPEERAGLGARFTAGVEDAAGRALAWRNAMPDSEENRDAMSFRELVEWAWRETPPVHKSSANLLIHLIAVPLFVAGHVLLIVGAILSWWLVAVALGSILSSLILQGVGHSLERQQVPAFTGPRDFLRRLYAEQFWNFWRFLGSGQWYAHLRSRKVERSPWNR